MIYKLCGSGASILAPDGTTVEAGVVYDEFQPMFVTVPCVSCGEPVTRSYKIHKIPVCKDCEEDNDS